MPAQPGAPLAPLGAPNVASGTEPVRPDWRSPPTRVCSFLVEKKSQIIRFAKPDRAGARGSRSLRRTAIRFEERREARVERQVPPRTLGACPKNVPSAVRNPQTDQGVHTPDTGDQIAPSAPQEFGTYFLGNLTRIST